MPSASSAVHTEIKTMSSVSANMVLISPVCPRAPTLRGGKALQSQRDREETWRDRPSRSATTLTAPSLHFRFRGADPELQASLPPSGRHSRERAATRKSRGPKARARPGLARVGKPGLHYGALVDLEHSRDPPVLAFHNCATMPSLTSIFCHCSSKFHCTQFINLL